jgi:DNA repair protein RadD
MLTHIAIEKKFKPGWIDHKYKEKFGTWPVNRTVTPQPPTPEVSSWVRSRQIAFAKMRQKLKAAA